MKCPICGEQMTNNKCYFCEAKTLNKGLKNNKSQKKSNIISNISATIFLAIIYFLLMGPFILIGISLTTTGISTEQYEKRISEEYIEATGVLSEFTECKSSKNKEMCKAKYAYDANGNTYYAITTNKEEKNSFKEIETIYFNQNNPEEYLIHIDTSSMTTIGIAILAITIIPFFFLLMITTIKRRKFN